MTQTIIVFILVALASCWLVWNYFGKKKSCTGCHNCASDEPIAKAKNKS